MQGGAPRRRGRLRYTLNVLHTQYKIPRTQRTAMAKTASINARIEPALKKQAEEILTAMGVSTSDAIGMFLRQVVLRRGLPFDVSIPNGTTVAALEELDRGGGKVFQGSTRELFDELSKR
jgi:DNA-damage-inducible protein J